jgi:hypothetical protein
MDDSTDMSDLTVSTVRSISVIPYLVLSFGNIAMYFEYPVPGRPKHSKELCFAHANGRYAQAGLRPDGLVGRTPWTPWQSAANALGIMLVFVPRRSELSGSRAEPGGLVGAGSRIGGVTGRRLASPPDATSVRAARGGCWTNRHEVACSLGGR